MTLKPATFKDVSVHEQVNPHLISVYRHGIRFSKGAASMMQLPCPLTFRLERQKLFAEKSNDGFQVLIAGTWNDFMIHNRKLCHVILDRFGKRRKHPLDKVLFQVTTLSEGIFQLKQIKTIHEKHNQTTN